MSACNIKWNFKSDETLKLVSLIIIASNSVSDLVKFIKNYYFSSEDAGLLDILNLLQLVIKRKLLKTTENAEQVKILMSNIRYVKDHISDFFKSGENQAVNEYKAKLNFTLTNRFIPICSTEVNQLIYKQLPSELFSITTYNDKLGIINEEILGDSLIAYKLKLFDNIIDYFNEEEIPLYRLDGSAEEEIYYSVMSTAWEEINNLISNTGGTFAMTIANGAQMKLVEFIKAFYILNNFDDFIKNISNGLITIDPEKFGNLEVTSDKYKRTDQRKKNSSWDDTHEDANPEHQTSKVWKLFFGTISDGRGGYLSLNEWNQITKFVNTLVNSGFSPTWGFISNPNLTPDEVAIALISALKNDTYLHRSLGKYGTAICLNIANKLQLFWNNFKDPNKNYNSSIKESANSENKLNFIELTRQELKTQCNAAYFAGEPDKADVKSASRITMSKERISTKLIDSLVRNLINKNYGIYNTQLAINALGSYLYSDNFIDFLYKATGILLSLEQKNKFTDDINIAKLFKFLFEYTNAVATQLVPKIRFSDVTLSEADITSKVKNFIDTFKANNQSYIEFSNVYIDENRNDVIKILDQSKNPQPLKSAPNTLLLFDLNLQDYKKQRGNKSTGNFILSNLGVIRPYIFNDGSSSSRKYLEHIVYRNDVKADQNAGGRAYIAAELTPKETLYSSFNLEFLYMACSLGTFYNQIECYSDKKRIALAAFNLLADVAVNQSGQRTRRKLITLDTNLLKRLWEDQFTDHYDAVRDLIKSNLSKVLGLMDNANYSTTSFEDLVKKLETKKIVDFERAASEYNRLHPNDPVNITLLIDYVPDKSKSNKEKLCKFNNTLWFCIQAGHQEEGVDLLDTYYDEGKLEFTNELKSIIIPSFLKDVSFLDNHEDELQNLFDITEEEWDNLKLYLTSSKYWVEGDNINPFAQKIIDKYYALLNLCTDADLFISTKHNVIHDGKVALELVLNITIDTIRKDQSARLVVGKKRNNADVATYIPMSTTTKYGVGKRSRIATIKSPKAYLRNYQNQENDGLDVHDGACHTIGIAMFWENLSFPGKKIENVKKVIGLIPSLASFSQFKLADFPIDNFALCYAFNNPNKDALDLLTVAKKMMSQGTFSDAFYEGMSNSSRPELGVRLYRYFGTDVYELAEMHVSGPKQMTFTWSCVTSPNKEQYSITLPIENTYDLWEAFGGRNSIEQVNGEWVTSNNSMEGVALLVSEYDPSCKERIISKVVDVSANKSGIVNINQLDDVNNPDLTLNTSFIDNSRWGMQQDFSHAADESTIPSLTQIIAAIAFNGKNTPLIKNMNEALAKLTLLNAKDLGIIVKGSEQKQFKFFKKLIDDLVYSLSTGAVRSDAISLVQDAADLMLKYVESNKKELVYDGNVPYSSPDLFYKLASNFITSLNKKSIKQTYNGIAIVQNPSVGIVGIYEDNKGNTYKYQDLVEKGRQIVLEQTDNGNSLFYTNTDGELEEVINMPESRFLEIALSLEEFQPVEVEDINELELEDTIELYERIEALSNDDVPQYNLQLLTPSTRLTNPKLLNDTYDLIQEWKKQGKLIVIRKTFNKQRDLKAPKLSFRENGVYKNFWFTEAVRQRVSANTPEKIAKAEEFYRRTLEALGSELPFYYPNFGDYDTTSFVTDVEYAPGELIIPKVNKTALNLGNVSLAEIMASGGEYFSSLVNRKFTKLNQERVVDGSYCVTVVKDNYEIVYTDNPVTPGNTVPLITSEEDGITYLQNENYVKMFPIPKSSRVTTYTAGEKTVYVVKTPDASIEEVLEVLRTNLDKNAVYIDSKLQELTSLSSFLNKYIDVNRKKDLQGEFNNYVKKLYLSFKLSNYTISGRIPSQSFLSFMANKTVAFMDRGINNGYVNIYEVWFTGSDYDIKLY